jgi:hypothetical protein
MPATKTARLEEKLDGLVALLKSATHSTLMVTDNISESANSSQIQPYSELLQSLFCSLRDERGCGPRANRMPGQRDERISEFYPTGGLRPHPPVLTQAASCTTSRSRSTTYRSPEASLPRGFEPSLEEADEFLKIFRTQMMEYFPFIIMSTSTTAKELRLQRPFLWLCIMAVTSKSSVQ